VVETGGSGYLCTVLLLVIPRCLHERHVTLTTVRFPLDSVRLSARAAAAKASSSEVRFVSTARETAVADVTGTVDRARAPSLADAWRSAVASARRSAARCVSRSRVRRMAAVSGAKRRLPHPPQHDTGRGRVSDRGGRIRCGIVDDGKICNESSEGVGAPGAMLGGG
jgi:hypothetical protein